MGTIINLLFTVSPSEAWRTVASVGSLACVEAGASIATRFVIGAVIQVLVAEKASPAFVTEAVPRLLAGSVQTSWIPLALVAERALPSLVTSAQTFQVSYK